MPPSSEQQAPPPCPRCGGAVQRAMVRSAFWHDNQPAIVEDIPAFVCSTCLEQYYDDDVSEALRRLAEEGFPADAARTQIVVPVFSLESRLRQRGELPDDTFVD
ncbi:MAG TPA: YgiT-type zinc finger protein [Vicinamibacterales bacterium]